MNARVSQDVDGLLRRAAAAMQSRQTGQAQRLFAQVLDLQPEQPVALNALGMQALGERDFNRARTLFARAAAADPAADALWMNLASAARGLGDDAHERSAIERALGLDQRNLTALVRLAELHERRGETADAAARWAMVIEAGRLIPNPNEALAVLLQHASAYVTGSVQQLADSLERAIATDHAALDAPARRRVDAAVAASLGRRRIFANECSGLHVPFLPADEFFDRGHFPWMDTIEAETAAIRVEAEALIAAGDALSPYVTMAPGTPESKWTALDGSMDWSGLHLWRHGERDDSACARCPRTAAVLDRLPLADMPARAPTVYFSVLQPGAHIPAHTGVTNARAIVHLPLVVPPGCRFRVGGEVRGWREGEAFAFDDTIEHEAWNDSARVRVVLILDVWNPHLTAAERAVLRTYFRAADEARDTAPSLMTASGHG